MSKVYLIAGTSTGFGRTLAEAVDVAHGVQLSTFKDIHGNLLGLRQNPQS